MNGDDRTAPGHGRSWGRFFRHFAEMFAAMVVGMMALGMVTRLVLTAVGHADVLDLTEVRALVMAVNMAVGMTVWMRFRGHGWPSIAEMDAAMVVPFLLLLVPYWAGRLSGDAVMVAGHVLMVPFMLGVMLRRRAEYSTDHRVHVRGEDQVAPRAAVSGGE